MCCDGFRFTGVLEKAFDGGGKDIPSLREILINNPFTYISTIATASAIGRKVGGPQGTTIVRGHEKITGVSTIDYDLEGISCTNQGGTLHGSCVEVLSLLK